MRKVVIMPFKAILKRVCEFIKLLLKCLKFLEKVLKFDQNLFSNS